jgi:hypothetical protein
MPASFVDSTGGRVFLLRNVNYFRAIFAQNSFARYVSMDIVSIAQNDTLEIAY